VPKLKKKRKLVELKSSREILRTHYLGLLKKVATWGGIVAILLTSSMVFITPAHAAPITPRSTTLGSSEGGVSTTYTWGFTGGTATTMRAIKFQICDSPLQTTACTIPTGATIAVATFVTGAPTSGGNIASWAISGTQNATQVIISNATGMAGNTALVVRFTGVTNPSAANTSFYTRITTYTDTAASLPSANGQDFGATAVSTGTEISVNANVQESLNFSVGSTGTCGSISGATVNIGNNPGTDNVLSSSAATAGTSVMCINTNALTGYVITYVSNQTSSNGFTNGTYTISDNSSGTNFTAATSGGADYFGINLRANNGGSGGPTAGADPSGGVAPTSYGTGYGTANTYAFVRGTQTTLVSQTTGATANTLYTVTYAAQAGTSTAVGAYQVRMNYIATGTF
jgi:hypothetical protein